MNREWLSLNHRGAPGPISAVHDTVESLSLFHGSEDQNLDKRLKELASDRFLDDL